MYNLYLKRFNFYSSSVRIAISHSGDRCEDTTSITAFIQRITAVSLCERRGETSRCAVEYAG
ncbi:MAG: hypothetical protein J07HQX50_01019 [Haloquadratum sp. J07HQX50]|nr:MAG: hypothetical protein J07HQX50_01019 [Haloquadratum sp. J07HQX50]